MQISLAITPTRQRTKLVNRRIMDCKKLVGVIIFGVITIVVTSCVDLAKCEPVGRSRNGIDIIGSGAFTCDVWLRDRAALDVNLVAQRIFIEEWLLGYLSGSAVLSGHNIMHHATTLSGPSENEEFYSLVDNYCKQKHSDQVHFAIEQIFENLESKSQKAH